MQLGVGAHHLVGLAGPLEVLLPTFDLLVKTHDSGGIVVRRQPVKPGQQVVAGRLLLPLEDG
jgi:hypothetical protein